MSKRFHIHQWSSAEMKAFCHVNWKFLMAKDRDAWYPNQMLSMGLIIFSSGNLDTMPLAALSHLHSAVMHRALCVLFYSWGAFTFGSSENAEVALCSVRLLMCSDVFWALICPQESCLEFFPPSEGRFFLDELWNSTFRSWSLRHWRSQFWVSHLEIRGSNLPSGKLT